MNNNYDLIATVNIDITNTVVDDASFDNLLIVGPLPNDTPEKAPELFGVYKSIEEVEDAGWVTTGDSADPVGVAARVAFTQKPAPKAIYIAPVQEDDTSALITVKRAMDYSGWYALCTAGVDESNYETIAEYIDTTEKIFLFTELDFFDTNQSYVTGIHFRAFGIFGCEKANQLESEIPEENKYLHVALAAKWLSYQSGTETSAFKTLEGVYPSKLSSSEIKKLTDANISYFTTVGGRNVTIGGKVMAGEWADVIRFRDWLKNDMQVRVVNLFITNSKVPFTDKGIGLIENHMRAALKSGQNIGGIAEDEFDIDGNIIPGYVTTVPLASTLTDGEKSSRKITDLRFKARLAGAIHFAEIDGMLSYSL